MEAAFSVLVDLILTPGSSLKLVPAINLTVLLLLILMLCLLYSKIALVHIIVMSSLAVGLLVSVNWFYYEFQKVSASSPTEKDTAGKEALGKES